MHGMPRLLKNVSQVKLADLKTEKDKIKAEITNADQQISHLLGEIQKSDANRMLHKNSIEQLQVGVLGLG